MSYKPAYRFCNQRHSCDFHTTFLRIDSTPLQNVLIIPMSYQLLRATCLKKLNWCSCQDMMVQLEEMFSRMESFVPESLLVVLNVHPAGGAAVMLAAHASRSRVTFLKIINL